MTCYYGGDAPDLVEGAHQILDVLMACYPNHNLKVYGYASGVFHITHLDFDGGNGWGMALVGRQFYSASHMRKEVIRQFGEWLERANLKRGAANGDQVKMVEGIPIKHQPIEYRREIQQQNAAVVGEVLREIAPHIKEDQKNGQNELPQT